MPIPVAVQSKAWVFGRSFAGIVVSNPARDMRMSVDIVVSCQVETSATGRSLIQRIPTEGGVSACDLETSTARRT